MNGSSALGAAMRYHDEHGGGSSGVFVGMITSSTVHLPTTRLDGTELQDGDYVTLSNQLTFPYTIDGVTFNSSRDKGVYQSGDWNVEAGVSQDTDETPVSNKEQESLSGTANYQNKVNKEFKERFEDIADEDTITLNSDDKVELKDKGHDATKMKDTIVGTGLEKSTDGTQIKHKNNIAEGDNDITLTANKVTFKKLSYDTEGHIKTNATGKSITLKNGIKSDANGNVEHSNAITAGNTAATVAANSYKPKKITYDAQGHITAVADDTAMTFKNGIKSDASGNVEHSNAVTAASHTAAAFTNSGAATTEGGKIEYKKHNYDAQGHTTSADATDKTLTFERGLSLFGDKLGHKNAITAQTTAKVFKVKLDKEGHISETPGASDGFGVQTSVRASGTATDTDLATEKAIRDEAEAIKSSFNPPKDSIDLMYDDGELATYDFLTTLEDNVFEFTFDDNTTSQYQFKGVA